jgi:spermidine synthase
MTTSKESPGSQPGIPPALLTIAAFLAGAAVMIVEISGNRLIAPVYGNTIYTWTSLIGVVLVAMSAGGYIGGRLADRDPKASMIGTLLGISGVATTLIPALAAATSGWVSPGELILGPLFLSSVMFLVPGVLLGAVSPYSVKLLSVLRSDHAVGRSAGLISMMGALGSFTGTFATGFWLLSAFDIRHILTTTGIALCLLALPFWLRGRRPVPRVPVLLLLAAAAGGATVSLSIPLASSKDMLFAKNTYYHLIRVAEQNDHRGGKIRVLMLDSTMEGGINMADDTLPLAYQNHWKLLENNADWKPEHALFIGAGAFGMPRHLSARWPEATVDVAEIDPEVITVGRRFFRLDEAPNVRASAADGRTFLARQPAARYDFIFGDAYNGVSYIPPHLVTAEFFGLVANRLKPDGIYMMNIIAALRGTAGELTTGVLGGLKAHFPHIAVFTVQAANPDTRQNLILMASRQPLDRFLDPAAAAGSPGQALLASRVPDVLLSPMLAKARPFTDMHNPIDRIIARALLAEHSKSTAGF